MPRNGQLRNLDVPLLTLPITVLVIQPHELVGFVRGVTGPVSLQFHPCIAWDVSHEVFRFIFITADKSDVHGKGE